MNSIIGLVVASLLVVGMVAIAIPNAIEAKKTHQWCVEGTSNCAETRGECNKFITKGGEPVTCEKDPI